jgi:GT2 family glycosyltransferase
VTPTPKAQRPTPNARRPTPTTTILILSVDEAHLLRHSLPPAAAQGDVVVIANACTDDTEALAREHGAEVLALAPRRSYAAAMNEAIARAGGDAVLLLNADCVLEPGFVEAARRRLDEPGVGSVAPKLLRTSGLEPGRQLGQIDAAGMTVDRRRKNGLVGHGAPVTAYARSGEAFGADGAAALYRRETLAACAIGSEVLDEDLGLWASDADLAWRAQLLGWRCAYEPRALARHVRTYSPSTRHGLPEAQRRLQFRNRYLMWFKNETPAGLLADLPWIVLYELLALGHVLLRERHLAVGYLDAARGLPRALRRRRAVQARRRVARPPFGLQPER